MRNNSPALQTSLHLHPCSEKWEIGSLVITVVITKHSSRTDVSVCEETLIFSDNETNVAAYKATRPTFLLP